MQKNKKLSIYDLNPRFFKDYTGNGTGDLVGLANKFDYFNYLGVNAIILQDVLSSHSNDSIQNYKSIAKEIGDINGLNLVLSHAKKYGIKIFLEMKIGTIKEKHNWFQTAVDESEERESNVIEFSTTKEKVGSEETKYNAEAKAYFAYDERTTEIPLNWQSDKVLSKFVSVIKFWHDLGIAGFVFKDFEYIGDKAKKIIMNEITLRELRKFYRSIKEINDNIIVIGKSHDIELQNAHLYTGGATKVFDYFQSTRISHTGTSNKGGKDIVGKFTASKLIKKMNKFANESANILSFGSENIGRFISRWGDEGQYNKESAKAFALLNTLTPASFTIYASDELGARNIGLTHLDDFQDGNLESRKSDALAKKISEKDFMDGQVANSPINARSLMMWNSNKNGGFSVSDKTITPPSIGYKENNVEVQYGDAESVLNFYKELNRIVTTSSFAPVINNGKWKITNKVSLYGVIKMSSIYNDKEVVIIVNLTDSEKRIISPKVGKVILSTYGDKKYSILPKKLKAYEGIMISKHSDEFIKETQIIKMKDEKIAKQEAKEKAAKIAAKEKAAELKLKEKAKAKEEAQKKKEQEEMEAQKVKVEKELTAAREKTEKEVALKLKEKEKKQEKETIAIEKEKQKLAEEKEKAKQEIKLEKIKMLEIKKEAREKFKNKLKLKFSKNEFPQSFDNQVNKEETTLFEESINSPIYEPIQAKVDQPQEENFPEQTKEALLADEVISLKTEEKQKEAIAKEKEKDKRAKEKSQTRQDKEFEKTRLIEIKKAAKEQRLAEKQAQEASLNEAKNQFSIMNEEVHPHEKTSLTEEEIAETTQIDIDDIDDIEDFLNKSK